MSDQDTIFKEGSQSVDIPDKGYLNQYVGEGKKYSSEEGLAKAYANAQQHIETIQSENKQLREVADKAANVDEVLRELRMSKEQGQTDKSGTLSEESVLELIKKNETEKRITGNMQFVDSHMKELFGEKAQEVMLEKAQELGSTTDAMLAIAKSNPKIFMSLFSTDKSGQSVGGVATTSSIQTTTSDLTQEEKPTVLSLLEKARKEGRRHLTQEEREMMYAQVPV